MAKKKMGLYTNLESSFNNKVEDLYLIVDRDSIIFSVKNNTRNEYVAFEHFENTAENIGWHQLIAYLQNNSKLIQSLFANIYFVWNNPRFILTKKYAKEDTLQYQQELDLVHCSLNEEELYLNPLMQDQVVVFSVPDSLSTLLSRTFPTGKWYHYIEFVLTQELQEGALLFLFENNFCLRLVKEGKQKLINYFPVEGDDQNCYTVLNACSHIFTNTNSIHLKLWGVKEIQTSFVNALVPYFKSFEMMMDQNGEMQTTLNKSYPNHIYAPYFIF